MHHYWFGDIRNDECVSCLAWIDREKTTLARCTRLTGYGALMPPVPWSRAVSGGCVRDRDEYLHHLRILCIRAAEAQLTEQAQRPDLALIEMVRALDEIDHAQNLLRERAEGWIAVTDPLSVLHRETEPAHAGCGALEILQDEIRHLQGTRRQMAREVSAMAATVLPNCSALVGGLVAARLLSEAGDLHTLAGMPASTLQVIGARKALFSHLRCGTAPPRHGIIYMDKAVHTATGKMRGKVARAVACSLGIAVKLDLFRGEPVPEFLDGARRRIARARGGSR